MSITIKQLRERVGEGTIKINVNGQTETLNFVYRPSALNIVDVLAPAPEPDELEEGQPMPRLFQQMEHLLVSWDVLDEDGQPLPATAEVMRQIKMDTPILDAIYTAARDDADLGKLQKRR